MKLTKVDLSSIRVKQTHKIIEYARNYIKIPSPYTFKEFNQINMIRVPTMTINRALNNTYLYY